MKSIADLPVDIRMQLMYQQDRAATCNSNVVVLILNTTFPEKVKVHTSLYLGHQGPRT